MKEDDEMSIRSGDGTEDSDEGEEEVFIYEEEIVHEYDLDEQADNDQVQEETFDSVYLFGGHTGNYDEPEEHCICTLACSPVDPFLVATGGDDDKAFVWKIGNPCAVIELQGHGDTVASITFSHDGQLLASGCYDGLVRVWDAALGTLKFALEGSGKGFEWTKWHPKGHLIIAGSEDSGVYMWNADRGHFLGCFSGHSDGVSCGGFTPDGHNYHQSSLSCMEITADSTIAITGALDGSVHMVNLSSGQVMSSLEGHEDSVECIGVSPSFGFAATGGMDNKLIIWELQRSSPRCICEHQKGVTCVTWLGTTQYVASGCIDGKVRIWDSLSGNCERIFTGHGRIHALALTADGTSIVSVSFDGKSDVFRI